ncbi:DUF4327 family protein [Pleurocapsa sp. FMAR1]|uniref:DUF4327 family protein n=1 Tax=Pleurocapsa sp. FMAR1 TaxID=3040204 RepID=UPI0029C66EAC|nr:DUF4327 family protein [Pleurocapsa sp. FMAR1]
MAFVTSIKRYSIETIKEEVHSLIESGIITQNQPLKILYDYLPAQQWKNIECELEKHDYLLRDRIIDLVGKLKWESD